MPKMKVPMSGIPKFCYELEGLLLNSRHLRNRLYLPWLGLSEADKTAFMKQVAKLAWRYILGKSFRYAVARTLIQKKGEEIQIDVKSPLFIYMRKRMYKGETRKMLIELESFAKEVERERKQRAAQMQRHVEKD